MNTWKDDTRPDRIIDLVPQGRNRAFTMTELLVVMATVTSLAAMLWPAIQQAGRRARAVACQGQLRQWGLAFSMFMDEHETAVLDADNDTWDSFWRPYCDSRRGLFLCPMATRHEVNMNDPVLMDREATGFGLGGKFAAWKLPTRTPTTPEPGCLVGSYGVSTGGLVFLDLRVVKGRTTDRSNIPVFLDGADLYTQTQASDVPPAYDGHLTSPGDMKRWCIDRHAGAINGLFLDWSVRKTGLKELWTLKWSPWFDPHGPWTRAGGVRPDDWPQWMRKFKDD